MAQALDQILDLEGDTIAALLKSHPQTIQVFEEFRTAMSNPGNGPLPADLTQLLDKVRTIATKLFSAMGQPLPTDFNSNEGFLKFAGSNSSFVHQMDRVEGDIHGVSPQFIPAQPHIPAAVPPR